MRRIYDHITVSEKPISSIICPRAAAAIPLNRVRSSIKSFTRNNLRVNTKSLFSGHKGEFRVPVRIVAPRHNRSLCGRAPASELCHNSTTEVFWASELHKLVSRSIEREVRGRFCPDPAHRQRTMGFHCLDADFQRCCDLLVAVALGYPFVDLPLPDWQ